MSDLVNISDQSVWQRLMISVWTWLKEPVQWLDGELLRWTMLTLSAVLVKESPNLTPSPEF